MGAQAQSWKDRQPQGDDRPQSRPQAWSRLPGKWAVGCPPTTQAEKGAEGHGLTLDFQSPHSAFAVTRAGPVGPNPVSS